MPKQVENSRVQLFNTIEEDNTKGRSTTLNEDLVLTTKDRQTSTGTGMDKMEAATARSSLQLIENN